MTITYPVTPIESYVLDANGWEVARTSVGLYGSDARLASTNRLAAALNYCADMADDQLSEDSAGTVREDRDRLLAALREIQRNPNDPRAHRAALDAMGGR